MVVAELNECFQVYRDVLGGVVILESEKRKTHFSTLDNEYHFGWYEKGRYAWELTDVRLLPEPVAVKGQQGLWNWEGMEWTQESQN
ncbi:hypothetical protein NYE69_27200 [Paenibacillus sp. FSL R5-0527]|uniref:hypothetical protein n=1 Tax=Paenibacillus sp. FSL R5-0527 TaxID=2975321 RepID=UPI0026B6BF89